jgi:hypothetical protein
MGTYFLFALSVSSDVFFVGLFMFFGVSWKLMCWVISFTYVVSFYYFCVFFNLIFSYLSGGVSRCCVLAVVLEVVMVCGVLEWGHRSCGGVFEFICGGLL